MALISCPKCGKQISDKAEKCIRCGTPIGQRSTSNWNIDKSQSKGEREQQTSSFQWLVVVVIIFGTILYATIWYIVDHQSNYDSLNKSSNSQTENAPSYGQKTAEVTAQKNPTENQQAKSEIAKQPTIEDRIVEKIVANTYSWYEDGNSATLSFQHEDNPTAGTMVLTGSIHTLEFTYAGDRNAIDAVVNPDRKCRFVYKYEIRGTNIHATFVKSDCGYDGKDNTLFYNESGNYITAYTSQGEMNFKP